MYDKLLFCFQAYVFSGFYSTIRDPFYIFIINCYSLINRWVGGLIAIYIVGIIISHVHLYCCLL